MKKRKLPGDNISLKTKKNESSSVMDWINCQTNLMDSLRFLVENEIRLNGVRNLQLIIPSERESLPSPSPIPLKDEIAVTSEPIKIIGEQPVDDEHAVRQDDGIDDADIESWL